MTTWTWADVWRFVSGVLGVLVVAFMGGLAWGACVVGARLVQRLVE